MRKEAQPETVGRTSAPDEPEAAASPSRDSSEVPRPVETVPPAEAPVPDGSGAPAPGVPVEASPKYRQQSRREAASGQSGMLPIKQTGK